MSVSGVEQREAPSNIETVTNRRQVSSGVDLEHQFQCLEQLNTPRHFCLVAASPQLLLGMDWIKFKSN